MRFVVKVVPIVYPPTVFCTISGAKKGTSDRVPEIEDLSPWGIKVVLEWPFGGPGAGQSKLIRRQLYSAQLQS